VNRRRREILTALTPAYDFAIRRVQAAVPPRDFREVPGLELRARASASASAAELLIYGRIGGGGWLSDAITAVDVANALKEAGPGPVNVRINSGGGDVFDGVSIHTQLSRHPGQITTYVDGLAASAASFIMLAGDHIVAARNAFVMIHDGMTYTYGNPATHREAADLLDKVSDNIADMYAERAGEDAPHWRNLMSVNGENGTWWTGQEALESGLVDEITGTAEDPEEDEEVAGRLQGWSAILPERALAIANRVPEPKQPELPVWDHEQLLASMKGLFA
jgi:ATP-dependent protease ClpP protease subunit